MSIYSLDDDNNRYNMDETVALKEQVASLQSNVESSISSLSARPYIVKAPYHKQQQPHKELQEAIALLLEELYTSLSAISLLHWKES